MFVERKNFPYVNILRKVLAAEKLPSARNTTAASVVEGEKRGSGLVATQPSTPRAATAVPEHTAPSHPPHTSPLSAQRETHVQSHQGAGENILHIWVN